MIAQTSDNNSTGLDNSLEFKDLPPFPDDVPVVPLLRIQLTKLLAGDAAETDRLWTASRQLGFFYLDLRAHETLDTTSVDGGTRRVETTSDTVSTHRKIDCEALRRCVDDLFRVGSGFFQLPVDEKVKYDLKSKGSYFGYKGFGQNIVDAQGNKDRNEFYNVSKDDIMGIIPPLPSPDYLSKSRPLIRSYMQQCHAIVTLILCLLNDRLGLPVRTLPDLHRLEANSGDQLRWVLAPPQPEDDRKTALGAHTDFGSVTVLFNRLGGLQVLPPGPDQQWQYVRPLRDHAVINLGDAMVKFSAGILRSNTHRVVNPPGLQAGHTRLSLVYFSRPEDEVPMRALEGSAIIDEARRGQGHEEGEVFSAKEWVLRRGLGVRVGGDYGKSRGTEEKAS